MERTLYEVIGVHAKATTGEIEAACLKLGDQYRIDKNAGNVEAFERFSEIERAYETLTDASRRAQYDAELSALRDIESGPNEVNATRWRRAWIAVSVLWGIYILFITLIQMPILAPSKGWPFTMAVKFSVSTFLVWKALLKYAAFLFVPIILLEIGFRAISWVAKSSLGTLDIRQMWISTYWRSIAIAFLGTLFLFQSSFVYYLYNHEGLRGESLLRLTWAQTSVQSSCSVSGGGQVSCTFHNTGSSEDSACVVVRLVDNNSSTSCERPDHPGWPKSPYCDGTRLFIASEPICSGLIRPQDVKQMTQASSFGLETMPSTINSIPKWCRKANDDWRTGCELKIVPVQRAP